MGKAKVKGQDQNGQGQDGSDSGSAGEGGEEGEAGAEGAASSSSNQPPPGPLDVVRSQGPLAPSSGAQSSASDFLKGQRSDPQPADLPDDQ